jgi:ABC-2 type transport system ATP-binding protein
VLIVAEGAVFVEALEKYFPPARAGWSALAQPFAPQTVCAIAGISFEIAAGEAVALIGPNGSGKSTLLRILATLLIPTRGCARIAGCDVVREPAAVRRQFGFHTGSDASFYARMSARENLQFFGALNNLSAAENRRRINDLADLLRLGDWLDRQVRTLSTGLVHRLGLARALLHRPAVLLLDEPTRSLDPVAATEFRRFLKTEVVGRDGTTLLFASHSTNEVEELAGRLLLLGSGRLLAFDAPARVRESAGAASLEQAMEFLARRAAERTA